MIRRPDRLVNARWARNVAWTELLTSTDRFLQAETAFTWQTDAVREKHGLKPEQPLTVEALMDRSRDEVWQNAVADCVYYSARMNAFGALHAAAFRELGLLETE